MCSFPKNTFEIIPDGLLHVEYFTNQAGETSRPIKKTYQNIFPLSILRLCNSNGVSKPQFSLYVEELKPVKN